MKNVVFFFLAGMVLTGSAFCDSLSLVKEGKATAVLVVPADAMPVAQYAAEELAFHIHLATGATLEICSEHKLPDNELVHVYIGDTKAAEQAGIETSLLPSEAVVLRTGDNCLYIAALDGPGDPLSTAMETSGTLWGVYELLERSVDARWLWPGDSGVYVKECDTVCVKSLDETITPAFSMRNLRPGLGLRGFVEGDPRLGFSPEQREQYAHNQTVFLRRHRMGRSAGNYRMQRSFGSGHSFHGWWERFGEEHPEWFQLLPDGSRGPARPERPDSVSMCVSNPELHQKIIELWQEERTKFPGEPVNIGVGENDLSAACICENCRAWDGPAPDLASLPEGLERSYEPVQAGNRYARFAKTIRELAVAIDPDVTVQYYAYLNYFWAPTEPIELHPNIIIGFVPWFRWAGWFPRTDAEQEWIKQQWLGWQKTGATVYYRPNWFLDGYAMPHVYMHQFADAFQFYAANEMMGTDFDSLQGMWAAQGPNLYLLARLHTRPNVPVETLLQEYYDGFGPASEAVKRYFAYWEHYSTENRERAADAIRNRDDGHFRRYANYAQVADKLYPPEVFPTAFALLDEAEAAAAASDNPVWRERIEFLRAGLQHALYCVEAAKTMNRWSANLSQKGEALSQLATYRRSVEHLGIANMDRAAIIETDSWQEVKEANIIIPK